jgi:type I restriction enzyme M protein
LAGNTTGITRDQELAPQIISLLFCKIFDELNTAPRDIVTFRAGFNEPPEDVYNRLNDLFETKVKKEYDDVFEETDKLRLDPASLVYVVGELQNYCITGAERDAISDAFQVFIGPALTGPEGQFFTPRNVIKLLVAIVDPAPTSYLIDPACGSGGFLVTALEAVWRKIEEKVNRNLGANPRLNGGKYRLRAGIS